MLKRLFRSYKRFVVACKVQADMERREDARHAIREGCR